MRRIQRGARVRLAGDEIEGAAHADGDRDGEPVPVAGDPLVLLGMPESDQENVGTALLDAANDVVVVHVVERRPRRLVDPGHDESRVRGGEAFGGHGRVAVFTAEEEDAGADAAADAASRGTRSDPATRPGRRDPSSRPSQTTGAPSARLSSLRLSTARVAGSRRALTRKSRLTVQIWANEPVATASMARSTA